MSYDDGGILHHKYIIYYIKQAYQQPANFSFHSFTDYGYCVEIQKEILRILKAKKEKEMEKAEKLKRVPQEELIAKMLALERKLEGKDHGEGTTVAGGGEERRHSKKNGEKEKQRQKQRRHSEKTDAHDDGRVKNFTEQWVERHSRDPSVKAKSAAVKEVGWDGDKERKEKEAVGSWGQDANEGWGGGGATW